jgi:hypothetical protein
VRRVLLDLADLGQVVVGDERLVRIQLGEGAIVLHRVGVDDLVPDEVLPLLGWPVFDVFVDDVEFRHGRHIEAGARTKQRVDDVWIGVGLDRVVGLHARQVLAEHGVVAPNLAMIDDEKWRAVLVGELFELPG